MKTLGARIRLPKNKTLNITKRRMDFEIVDEAKPLKIPTGVNALVFDLETAPISAHVWSLWQDNAGVQGVVTDWFTLSWAAKWLFNNEIMSDVLTPQEAPHEADARIMRSLWKLIDKADILIGHNIDKFDVKKINTRFITHGLKPPSPYQTIDTLKIAKKNFAFSSNKLDYINEVLQIGRKIETGGFKLWKACLRGDPVALAQMDKYCRRDVGIAEETYVAFRPWIKSHPNMGMYVDTDQAVCPTCGGTDLSLCGVYRTIVSEYNAFRCSDCGAIGRYNTKNNKAKPNRTRSVAR